MQGHLDALVAVLVVHVVNDVERVHIHAGEPAHHVVELLDHVVVDLVAVLLGGLHGDADAAVHVQRALQGLVRLEANDRLALGMGRVDVACRMAHDTGNGLRVHIEHAALLALLGEQLHDVVPKIRRALRGAGQERTVALVGGVVALDEVANVNLTGPRSTFEAFPCFLHCVTTLLASVP